MNSPQSDGYTVGIDVGGTFVDITIRHRGSSQTWVGKVFAELGPIKSVVVALREAVRSAGTTLDRIDRIVHGTTLTTNHVLEERDPRTALLTTSGFESILDIGRHDSPRSGNIHRWVKPKRPIERQHIFGVLERKDWTGETIRAIDRAEVERTIERLKGENVESVAVCFLHAHVNGSHENEIRDMLNERAPEMFVSLSHEVLPYAGEYERAIATVLDASVKPVMSDYINGLLSALAEEGVGCPIYLMASDGGVMSIGSARDMPIRTLLSGPAAGAAGAAALGMSHGIRRVFTLDVGGTSSDVSCAEDGRVDTTASAAIGAFPIALPVLDVHTVGAGGGSIASIAADRFVVGPESAGSSPGPIAYGRGGNQPTVSDAHLVLGRLPDSLAGGALRLSVAAARAGFMKTFNVQDDSGIEEAALGVLSLANLNMANAIRRISTERGRDPRDYTLVAYGGAGGAHAIEVARRAGVRQVLIPRNSGVFTTQGLLTADITFTSSRVFPQPPMLSSVDLDELRSVVTELTATGFGALQGDSSIVDRHSRTVLDLRYVNQAYDLPVQMGDHGVSEVTVRDAEAAFHKIHLSRYGYSLDDVAVELVGVKVVVFGELESVAKREKSTPRPKEQLPMTTRPVRFTGTGWVETPTFPRARLVVGQEIAGPAIIEEYDSTIVLPPGSYARVETDGAIRVDPGEGDMKMASDLVASFGESR